MPESPHLERSASSLHTELDSLSHECSTQNWDGYGAKAVSPEAFQAAERFIDAMPAGIPQPHLAADPDGCVTFEWGSSPTRTLLVSIQPGNALDYAALIGTATAHGSEPFFSELPEVLEMLLKRVLRE